MADVKKCDRCGEVFHPSDWMHNPRTTARVEEHTAGATSYSPDEYELCLDCTADFRYFVEQYDD